MGAEGDGDTRIFEEEGQEGRRYENRVRRVGLGLRGLQGKVQGGRVRCEEAEAEGESQAWWVYWRFCC